MRRNVEIWVVCEIIKLDLYSCGLRETDDFKKKKTPFVLNRQLLFYRNKVILMPFKFKYFSSLYLTELHYPNDGRCHENISPVFSKYCVHSPR